MKLREYDIDDIIADLRILSYTETIDDTPTTVTVELWPSSANAMAVKIFKSLKGELMADDILEEYADGDWTHTDISDMIKTLHGMAWKQLWLLWVSEYNPLFNVDGKEVRIVETQYGKKTTMEKGTTVETAYDSSTETEYDSNDTNEQLVNGSNTTQHGLAVTHTEPTVTDKVATFDLPTTIVSSERDATQHSDTNSGTDTVTINNGKSKLTRDGKDTISRDGKDTVTYDGTDTDTLSGKDTVTDTFVRGGNIGTTMTTQLLRDGESFWSAFNFFNAYFADIAGDLTIPIYE